MDKIAIISDIHGNLEALKTVLSDIKERNIDKIYCLGDIISKGLHPHECIELVRENCEVTVLGNTDEYFSRDFTEEDYNALNEARYNTVKFNRKNLTKEDIKFLRNLPYCHEFYMSGKLVRLFHGTPTKLNGVAGNIDKIENSYTLFLPSENTITNEKADIAIYGHTHVLDLQKMYNRTMLNAGSVGDAIDIYRNSKKDGKVENTTCANYLIISGTYGTENAPISYEFVNIPYDIEKELIGNNENPDKEAYEAELKFGTYRNKEKLNKYLRRKGINPDEI